jgi:hypothetical protein
MTISPAPASPMSTRAAMNSATDVEYAHAADPIPNSAFLLQQEGGGYLKVIYARRQVKDTPSIGTDGKLPAG